MLHTKFQLDYWFLGEEDFEGFVPYMGMAAIWTLQRKFHSPIPWMVHMKLDFNGPVVSEEKMFDNVDRRQTTEDS